MASDTIKYTLSNAPAEISAQRLAQMQAQRFWIERSLQDGESESGLADYQARQYTTAAKADQPDASGNT